MNNFTPAMLVIIMGLVLVMGFAVYTQKKRTGNLTARGSLLLAFYAWRPLSAYGQSYSPLDRLTRPTGQDMSFLTWIVVGLIAGFIGSKIVNRRGEGIVLDILLGIAGAFVGGWLLQPFGARAVNGLNLNSIFVAVVGSVVLLVLYHVIRGRRSVF